MFISEVVMVYLDPDAGSEIIRWAAAKYANAAFLTYEQVCVCVCVYVCV